MINFLPACLIALCAWIYWIFKYPQEHWDLLMFRNLDSKEDYAMAVVAWIYGACASIGLTAVLALIIGGMK